tara:strand:- start:98 stop:346 length:249 start_codon:yes stop_codon:yes gene_type:complete
MGSYKYIAYLCSTNNKKELMEEVSGIASMMGKDVEEVADGFIEAYNKAEENKDDPAYQEIAKIQAKATKFYINEHNLEQESK